MKKAFALILFFALTFSATAQDQTVDGCWGIKFGLSMAEAKKIILSKPGVTHDAKSSTPTALIFDGGTFAGRAVTFTALKFVGDKLYDVSIFFTADQEPKTVDLYDDIKSDLNTKYYVTDSEYESFKSPYSKTEDRGKYLPIKMGYADYSTYWSFARDTPEHVTIALVISTSLNIRLTYQHAKLTNEAVQKVKSKNDDDL